MNYASQLLIAITIMVATLINAPICLADSTKTQFAATEISSSYDSTNQVGTIIVWYSKRSPGQGWLECNGQTFDQEAYPKLYLYLGQKNTVPDLRSLFLRSGNASQLGTLVADSIASHTVDIDEQTLNQGKLKDTSGSAYLPAQTLNSDDASLSVSGTAQGQKLTNVLATTDLDLSQMKAAGQKYSQIDVQGSNQYYWARDRTGQDSLTENYFPLSGSNNKYYNTNDSSLTHERSAGTKLFSGTISTTDGYAEASKLIGQAKVSTNLSGQTDGGTISGTATGRIKSILSQSSLAASLTDGTVSGVIGAHHGTYSGGSETAPKHIYVRYFIRAL